MNPAALVKAWSIQMTPQFWRVVSSRAWPTTRRSSSSASTAWSRSISALVTPRALARAELGASGHAARAARLGQPPEPLDQPHPTHLGGVQGGAVDHAMVDAGRRVAEEVRVREL